MRLKAVARASGYTLIEILVVLLIISIVTTVALLSLGHNQTKAMQGLAEEFTQSLSLAEEQAMLAPAVMGLVFDGRVWRFATLSADDEGRSKSQWVPWQDETLHPRNIPAGMEVHLQVMGSHRTTPSGEPMIVISTNGDITPFTLTIGKPGERPRFKVSGHVDGSFTTEHLS